MLVRPTAFFLQFLNEYNPTPEKVSSSLLQGDPWSMLGMSVMLLPAAQDVARSHPETVQVLYADDRTIAASTVLELKQVIGIWHEWGQRLGLVENRQKAQYYHATTEGRRSLLKGDVPADQISSDARVLGYCFQGTLARKDNKTEQSRLQKAHAQAFRVRCLPGSLQRKIRLGQYVVPAKAGYGWICRNPSKQDVKPLERACRILMEKPKQASPHLFKLVRGHFGDLKFLATQSQVSVLHRYACKTASVLPPRLLSKAGWPRALAQGLYNLGWEKLRQWTWYHAAMNKQITLSGRAARQKSTAEILHLLRESWRRELYHDFSTSKRSEPTRVVLPAYDEHRVQALRQGPLSSDELAVATGTLVSPACFQRMTGRDDVHGCPYCGVNAEKATLEHCAWLCESNNRPSDVHPADNLERRLGWSMPGARPACRIWLAEVRKRTLEASKKHWGVMTLERGACPECSGSCGAWLLLLRAAGCIIIYTSSKSPRLMCFAHLSLKYASHWPWRDFGILTSKLVSRHNSVQLFKYLSSAQMAPRLPL